MSKRQNRRPQRRKDNGNREMYDAMQELRRSSAATPHRNRARYSRNDFRNARQAGQYGE